MNTVLYDEFILNNRYKSLKKDGGNDLYEVMLEFIRNTEDESISTAIKEEIHFWLLIGRTSYFLMAVNFIGDLKLYEFVPELQQIKLKIIKKDIPDLPDYCVEFIDESLKRIG